MSTGQRPWPRQLSFFGALGALLTLFVAATAVLTLSGTVQTGAVLGQVSRAQRYHQDADMMHDALRADVASAQEATRSPSSEAGAAVLRAAQSHARQLNRDQTELTKLNLPGDLDQALAGLSRSRQAYAALAVRLVGSMAQDRNPAIVGGSGFMATFNALATRQARVTNKLADTSARMEQTQARKGRTVAMVLLFAAVVALAGWGVLVAMLQRSAKRLFDALGREAEQRAVAEQLQRSLLPERLPVIPGLRVAARTKPVDSALHVGGDWYDVISLPSGDVGLVVGDVVGHDLAAAIAMGQLRAALRAFAVYEPSPAAVLTRVNTVADLLHVTDLTTCLYAVVDPSTRTVRWSSAGHLNPLVVGATGEGKLLEGDPGPPIGVSTGARYVDRTCQMEPRGLLMLYTDGLVERRSSSITDGLTRLQAIPGPHGGPEGFCDEVLAVLIEDDASLDDDVTLLALQA